MLWARPSSRRILAIPCLHSRPFPNLCHRIVRRGWTILDGATTRSWASIAVTWQRARQTGRNFVFFNAPVGVIFTIHGALTKHSWLDFGLFLQTLILAAQVRGLATCPQVSFVRFQFVIGGQVGLDPEEMVTCGMSLGYADVQAAVNRLNMPREPLETFTCWVGFDE